MIPLACESDDFTLSLAIFYGSKLAHEHNSHTLYYSENHIVFKLYKYKLKMNGCVVENTSQIFPLNEIIYTQSLNKHLILDPIRYSLTTTVISIHQKFHIKIDRSFKLWRFPIDCTKMVIFRDLWYNENSIWIFWKLYRPPSNDSQSILK